jgi:DNA repair exonuclease SbcCD ATPase subunit
MIGLMAFFHDLNEEKTGGEGVRLQKLSITNFKGIGSFVFEPSGANADIYGTNETGKTTILDAFTWLLTDKDSQNASQFSIKPIGGLKKGAQVEVEGVFDIHGKAITLKKAYTEVWKRRRGSASKEFTGHENLYFVNGVPVKLKGYNEKLKEICDPSLFRMLTNLRYVNEEMKWQDRRKLLIDVCGVVVTDEDVMKMNKDFAAIPIMLDGKTIDELREEIKYAKTGINDELKKTPVRIDELSKSLPETPRNPTDLKKEKEDLESKISELSKDAFTIMAGGAIGMKNKELLDVENEIWEIETKISNKRSDDIEHQASICRAAEADYLKSKETVEAIERSRALTTKAIKNSESEIEKLRALWHEENGKTFEVDTVCPTCGQDIPKDQIRKARQKFNTAKAGKLEDINALGKEEAERLEILRGGIEENVISLSKAKEKTEKAEADYLKAKKALEEIKGAPDPKPTKDHQSVLDKKEGLTKEISRLESEAPDTSAIDDEIQRLENDVESINEKIADIKADEKNRKRIKELSAQEKELATEYEKLEEKLQLIENFTRAKCDLLTERINSKFNITKWVLFENQINGGLKDVCTATVGGVPYPDLNNAARINCGIDIINTLSDFYDVMLPMFVDNSESIIETLPTKAQAIRMVVEKLVKCGECGWIGPESALIYDTESGETLCPACACNDHEEYRKLKVVSEEDKELRVDIQKK